jgi:Peptidase C13 family
MSALRRTLVDGLRLTFLLRPRPFAQLYGPGLFLAAALVDLAAQTIYGLAIVPDPRAFNPEGIQSIATDCLFTLLAAGLIATLVRRREIVWMVGALLLATTAVFALVVDAPAIQWLLPRLMQKMPAPGLLVRLAIQLWWLLIVVRLVTALGEPSYARRAAAIVLGFLGCTLPWWYLESAPLWQPDYSAYEQPDSDARRTPSFDAESVMYDQPRMLQQAIDRLTPQTPGKVDLYVVGFAGDGEENVFRNEVEFVEKQFGERFDAKGHTLMLINNPATIERRPLASLTALESALDAVAEKMDGEEDILLVFLTSHGSKNHELYVSLSPLPLDQITPEDLAQALNDTSVRSKVVIISACYSGGFVDALKGPDTLVITAARADRTSFGCGADSDITYFGRAFFAEALNETASLTDAFERARQQIESWEEREEQDHSYPQIASAPAIEGKLEAWRKGIKLGPAVPFEPVAPAHKPPADGIFSDNAGKP